MDRALAASGILVVAIDMTLAPEAPYPACVQDANYGVRWLKWKAASWNGDPSRIGVYGSSSGGHVAELLSMRPRDPRYNAIPLPEARELDATVAYVAMRSPISDPYARFQNAEANEARGHGQEPARRSSSPGKRSTKQPAADPRPEGEGQPGADAAHAGRARRQRAPGRFRRNSPTTYRGRRRRHASSRCSRAASTSGWPSQGRQTDTRPGDGQGVRRAPAEDDVAQAVTVVAARAVPASACLVTGGLRCTVDCSSWSATIAAVVSAAVSRGGAGALGRERRGQHAPGRGHGAASARTAIPDLQGVWLNSSATPRASAGARGTALADRPGSRRDSRRRADRLFKNTNADFAGGDAVHLLAARRISPSSPARRRPAAPTR